MMIIKPTRIKPSTSLRLIKPSIIDVPPSIDMIYMSKNELLAICKERKIKGISHKNKPELIKLIQNDIFLNLTKSETIPDANLLQLIEVGNLCTNSPYECKQNIEKENDQVIDVDKQHIIDLFKANLKGIEICLDGQNINHCGKEGHFAEDRMGIHHNSKNEPDINGYEMKTGCKVTTFIDKKPDTMLLDGNEMSKTSKKKFWDKYGSEKKSTKTTIGGWSINKCNKCGQKIIVDGDNNICVLYDYKQDTRENKEILQLNKEPHIIMQWNSSTLKHTIENKFNKKGFFKLKKIGNKFETICFGKKITFDVWIAEFKKGIIYHDGYSKLNGRERHVFRASNKFWDELITEEY